MRNLAFLLAFLVPSVVLAQVAGAPDFPADLTAYSAGGNPNLPANGNFTGNLAVNGNLTVVGNVNNTVFTVYPSITTDQGSGPAMALTGAAFADGSTPIFCLGAPSFSNVNSAICLAGYFLGTSNASLLVRSGDSGQGGNFAANGFSTNSSTTNLSASTKVYLGNSSPLFFNGVSDTQNFVRYGSSSATLQLGGTNGIQLIGNTNDTGTLAVNGNTTHVGNSNFIGAVTDQNTLIVVGDANMKSTAEVNGVLTANSNLVVAGTEFAATGTGTAPSLTFTGHAGYGLDYNTTNNAVGVCTNGNEKGYFDNNGALTLYGVSTTAAAGSGLYLGPRDATGVHIFRNGSGIVQFGLGDDSGNGTADAKVFATTNTSGFPQFSASFASTYGFGFPTSTTVAMQANGRQVIGSNSAQDLILQPNPQGNGNNGSSLNFKSVNASTTLSGATTTLVTIPAGSMVMMVTARVTTTITSGTATTWSLGTGVLPNDWGTGLAFASGTTVDGTNYTATGFTAPQMYPSATSIVATPNAGTFTGGVVETIVYYVSVTAPTQ